MAERLPVLRCAAVVGRRVVTNPQDPLPEIKTPWRRAYSYATTLITLGLVGYIVARLTAAEQLAEIAFWLICLNALIATYYMIAPSAEEIVRTIKAAAGLRKGGGE